MNEYPSPGLPRRLAALTYDTLLILPFIMVNVGLATLLQLALTGEAAGDDYSNTLHPRAVQAIALLTVVIFYVYFWCLKGQTLGMQAWRIRLCKDEGEVISLGQALLRCAGACVSLALAGAGYWWCLFDRKGRYWHDHWSRSHLQLLPKRKKS
jgi:uncharacterized RDD family membrane protein YckC